MICNNFLGGPCDQRKERQNSTLHLKIYLLECFFFPEKEIRHTSSVFPEMWICSVSYVCNVQYATIHYTRTHTHTASHSCVNVCSLPPVSVLLFYVVDILTVSRDLNESNISPWYFCYYVHTYCGDAVFLVVWMFVLLFAMYTS